MKVHQIHKNVTHLLLFYFQCNTSAIISPQVLKHLLFLLMNNLIIMDERKRKRESVLTVLRSN